MTLPPLPTAARRGVDGARVFRIVVGTVIVAAALRLAAPVLVPLVTGLFLAVLARPMQCRLAAVLPRGLRWLGLVAAMLTVIAGLAAFGGALGLAGRAVAGELRERRPRIEATLEQLRGAARRAGLPASVVPSLSSPPPQGGTSGGTSGGAPMAGAARRAVGGLAGGLATLLLALGFAALALAEVDDARTRVARALGPARGRAALDTFEQTTRAFRRYAWVKTATSALTGVATTLAALAFGLPLAWVWGLLAFLLEYVPSVGSAIAVLPPTLMALASAGPGRAGAVFLGLGTLQVILGNVVDPRLEGRFMRLSPFGVLLSIVVWGWLWGALGALLAVPLTVAIVIACRHIPGAHGAATLLAGDAEPGSDGTSDDASRAARDATPDAVRRPRAGAAG